MALIAHKLRQELCSNNEVLWGPWRFRSCLRHEDTVEVTVGNVLMCYSTCYVMVCDTDRAVNSAAFSQLVTSEELHRSNHRRPTLTPCPASLPWVNWLTIFRTITVNRIMCVWVLFIIFHLLFDSRSDSSLPLSSPHSPASNDPSSNCIPLKPSASD